MFLLKFSLLSKTVPRYLYSVTLSTFMSSIKTSGMAAGAFLQQSARPFVTKCDMVVHRKSQCHDKDYFEIFKVSVTGRARILKYNHF